MKFILKLDVVEVRDNIRRTEIKEFEAKDKNSALLSVWEYVGKRDAVLAEIRTELEELKLFEEIDWNHVNDDVVHVLLEILFQRNNFPISRHLREITSLCNPGEAFRVFVEQIVKRVKEEYEKAGYEFVGRNYYRLIFSFKVLNQYGVI